MSGRLYPTVSGSPGAAGSSYPMPQAHTTNIGIPWISGSSLLSSSFGTNAGEIVFQMPRGAFKTTMINQGAQKIYMGLASITASAHVSGSNRLTILPNGGSFTLEAYHTSLYFTLENASSNCRVELVSELNDNIPGPFFLSGSGITA